MRLLGSAEGLPIGNYLSQILSNFYMSYFDHWIKEALKVSFYHRYADDIVIFANSKEYLHNLFTEIESYLWSNLKLKVNNKHQVFPIEIRGVDFVGYRMFGKYTWLRKRTKKRMFKKISKGISKQSLASYKGILRHCNSVNLLRKVESLTT